MKPLIQDSVGAAMATKCSSNATMVTEYTVPMRSHKGHRHAYANHRKSAVELLEASKGEYVKSTKVLNHKQKLKHPENLSVGNREVLSLPIAGKLPALDDALNVTPDNSADNTSGQISTTEQRSLNKSPSTFHSESLKTSSNDSQSPPAVKKLASSLTHSSDATNSLLSSSVSPASSPIPSSVSSSVVSASPETISTASSLRKALVTSSAVSSASFTTNPPSVAKKISISSTGSSLSFTSSHSNSRHDDDHSSLKKPLTSPSTLTARPVVPPKPANKPAVAPKVGPKPVIHKKSEKPAPPPRPARKPSAPKQSETPDDNTDMSERTMSSNDKNISVSSNNQVSNSSDQKRFSSVSASACETSSKESDSVDGSKVKSKSVRESRYSLSSQSEVFLKPLCANNLSTSVGILVERKRSPIPKPRIDKQLNEIELPPRRPLHRSQSDLSNCRHSRNSSDFSDLSSRLSRTSTEVERFFNEMGIDHSVLEPMRRLSETKQRGNLDSVSSLDSLDRQSLSSRLSIDLERLPMESEQDLSERGPGNTSVVERNARIIKWLCNVKKARTVQTKHVNKKS